MSRCIAAITPGPQKALAATRSPLFRALVGAKTDALRAEVRELCMDFVEMIAAHPGTLARTESAEVVLARFDFLRARGWDDPQRDFTRRTVNFRARIGRVGVMQCCPCVQLVLLDGQSEAAQWEIWHRGTFRHRFPSDLAAVAFSILDREVGVFRSLTRELGEKRRRVS